MSWLNDLFSGDAKLLNKIKAQDFREQDSQIVSALMNPKKAGGKLADWLGNQVSTAAGLPVQPTDEGEIYAKEPDRFSKAMAALNIAGFAQGGSMPFAPKSAGGTLGTFIGPKAANWNKKAAATATQLLDNGVDPAQVWKEHLIGRMPDKSLFSEIDDSAAKYVGPGAINKRWEAWTPHGMADKAYLHDELFKNYPELKNVGLQEIYNTEGSFNPINKEIQIGLNDNALKVLGHEFQHAIQHGEGWAKGGSPEAMSKGFRLSDADLRSMNDEVFNKKNVYDFFDKAESQGITPLQVLENQNKQWGFDTGNPRIKELLSAIKTKEQAKSLWETDKNYLDNYKQNMLIKPHERYRRLTGEAQARATEDRMNLNMQQRRDSYPLAKGLLADIKLKDLISRYGTNGPAMSVNKLPETQFSKAHAIAQKNAALPVEQGGLGLPANNTAIDRAKAMGFDVETPVYHGTNSDFNSFNLDKSGSASGAQQFGSGVYTTTNPFNAGGYANPNIDGSNILPLLVKLKSPIVDGTKGKLSKHQIRSILQKAPELEDALYNFGDVGYEGKNKVFNKALNQIYEYQDDKLLENLHPISNDFFSGYNQEFNDAVSKTLKRDGVQVNFDNGEKFKIPFNPNQVRSRFAAFDPLKKNSANILASMLLGSVALDKFKDK